MGRIAVRSSINIEGTENLTNRLSDLSRRARIAREETLWTLKNLKAEGKSVWGFGAAAKGTIFLNYCGIDSHLITAIADDTPTKQRKFIPGTEIQVVSVEEWLRVQPDYTIILCWNFAHTVARKYASTYKGIFFTWYSGMGVSR
jgi:hypothetical protein